jgi:hypothetical protein
MAVRRPLAPLPVESVEYVLDCLEHGIGAAEVQGDVPDILDEPFSPFRKDSAHVV